MYKENSQHVRLLPYRKGYSSVVCLKIEVAALVKARETRKGALARANVAATCSKARLQRGFYFATERTKKALALYSLLFVRGHTFIHRKAP